MWGNTDSEEFTNIIKRINKLDLSRSAEEIFIKTIFQIHINRKNSLRKCLQILKSTGL